MKELGVPDALKAEFLSVFEGHITQLHPQKNTEILPNSFCEANFVLIPKPENIAQIKPNYNINLHVK